MKHEFAADVGHGEDIVQDETLAATVGPGSDSSGI
jgi:hypothetical protein